MTSHNRSIEKLIALCAEGARQFGDNPSAIANYVKMGIDKFPDAEQRQLKQQLALLTDQSESGRQNS